MSRSLENSLKKASPIKKQICGIVTALLTGVTFLSACLATPPAGAATCTLTINIEPAAGGTVSPEPGEYHIGELLVLRATPAAGYRFDYWDGDIILNYSVIQLNMDGDKTVTAHFKTDDDTLPDPGSYQPGAG